MSSENKAQTANKYYFIDLISKSTVINVIAVFSIAAIFLAQIVAYFLWHYVYGVDLYEVIFVTFLTTIIVALPLLTLFAYIIREIVHQNNDLKQNEIELNFQKAQLTEAMIKLKGARDMAIEANNAKSRFLANMSHEFRTPLTAIIGYAELLVDEFKDQPFSKDLDKILDSSRHLLDLVNDVLDLAKIEAGKEEMNISTFPIPKLIDEVLEITNHLSKKNNNVIHIDFENDVKMISTDRSKIRRCLINLLSNACKFTENGNINLKIFKNQKAHHPMYFFEVKDTGIGMTEKEIEKIFKSFTQADETTTRKYGGTGLGLAITKKSCQLLGGDVMVQSEKGRGSTFTMYIPSEDQY